jgi:DNA polymerase-3 subunit alpha
MDGFGYNRAELLQGYARFIEQNEQRRKDESVGQVSLFELNDDSKELSDVVLERRSDWGRSERLQNEKSVLGFYLSSHPLSGLEQLVNSHVTTTISDLNKQKSKSVQKVLGLVSTLKEVITKKGTRMAFVSLEDTTGDVELVVFPDTFSSYESALKSGEPLLVTGELEVENDKCKMLVEKIERVSDSYRKSKRLIIKIGADAEGKLALLKEIFSKNPGSLECVLQIELPELKQVVDLKITDPNGINPTPMLFEQVAEVLNEPQWRLM